MILRRLFHLLMSQGQKSFLSFLISRPKKEIESWTNPLVQKFVRKSGLMDAMLDAEFKTVTFLSQLQHTEFKAASNKVENQLPEELKSLSYYTKEPKTSIQTLLKNKADT